MLASYFKNHTTSFPGQKKKKEKKEEKKKTDTQVSKL